jgi:hypothetical protein
MHKTVTLSFFYLWIATQLPALYPLTALPDAKLVTPFILLGAGLVLAALLRPPHALKPILNTAWPVSILTVVLAILCLYAPLTPATSLSWPTGWNFLTSALPPILTPIAMLFAIAALRITNHPWHQTNLMLLSFGTCALLYTLTAQGSPMPAWSLLMLSVTLLIGRPRMAWVETAALIFIMAVLATANPALIVLPLLIAISLFAVWPMRALNVAIWGTLASVVLYVLPTWPVLPPNPLELAWQSFAGSLPGPEFYPAIAFILIVAAQMVYHWRWWPPTLQATWALAAPLFVISMAQLATTASLPLWTGAALLIPPLALAVHTILRPNFKL